MVKYRIQNQYLLLPPPSCTPNWCAYEAGMIAAHLLRKHKARKWQVKYLVGMLTKSYLLSLLRLKRDTIGKDDSSPKRLRWLWCTWGTKNLGWRESRPQGHHEGFNFEVYQALAEKVYPFPKVERDEKGSHVISTCKGSNKNGRVQPISVDSKRRALDAAKKAGWIQFM